MPHDRRKDIKEEYINFLAPFAYVAWSKAIRKGTAYDSKAVSWEVLGRHQRDAWRAAMRASGRRILPHMFEE